MTEVPKNFKERAEAMLSIGLPVIPLYPRDKNPCSEHAALDGTTDPAIVNSWIRQMNPDCNVGVVAQYGGFWFLDDDRGNLIENYERETGLKFPTTRTVKTGRDGGGFHFTFLHDDVSRATRYNNGKSENGKFDVDGILGECRCNNQYVVSPFSVHPESGKIYELVRDLPILNAPKDLLDWLQEKTVRTVARKKEERQKLAREANGVVEPIEYTAAPGGGLVITKTPPDVGFAKLSDRVKWGPVLRRMQANVDKRFHIKGLFPGEITYCPIPSHGPQSITFSYQRCFGPMKENPKVLHCFGCEFSGDVVKAVYEMDGHGTMYDAARTICNEEGLVFEEFFPKPYTPKILVNDTPVNTIKIKSIEIEDMPDEALGDSRLAEICRARLHRFPRAYGWPALLTTAAAMVPAADFGTLVIGEGTKTNLYTALVGPPNTGKSQAIDHARRTIGLPEVNYSDIKAGSPEGLLKKVTKLVKATNIKSLVMDIDEWKHYFEKAAIDKSSFMTVMNTNFYKDDIHLIIAGGIEIAFKCSMSWIGGIVLEEYGDVVGSAALGGFYDRLYQSICPSGHVHFYRPWGGIVEETSPTPVTIDGSVWEVVDSWKRLDNELGRVAELAIRIESIVASFDGKNVLTGRDMESKAVIASLEYQKRVRLLLQPNAGDIPDAKMSNAVVQWLQAHTRQDNPWVSLRDLKRGVKKTVSRLGPSVLNRALTSLALSGDIEYGEEKTAGRTKKAIRLSVDF